MVTNNIPKHNCLENLDTSCRCRLCMSSNHFIVSDDDGSGTGRVNEACLRCGKTAAFYSESGYELYNDMTGAGKGFSGEKASKEGVIRKLIRGHDCSEYAQPDGTCLLCGKHIT